MYPNHSRNTTDNQPDNQHDNDNITPFNANDKKERDLPYYIAFCNYLVASLYFFFSFGPGMYIFLTPSSAISSSPISSISTFFNVWLLAAPIINLAIIVRTIKVPLTRNLYKTFLYTCAVCVGIATILLYAILSSFEPFLMNPQLSGAIMPILLLIPQACIVTPIILVSVAKKKTAFSTSTAKIFRILIIGLSVLEIIITVIGFLSTFA